MAKGDGRRVVVKIGTGVLTRGVGELDTDKMSAICYQIADAKSRGCEVILVSSGAVGLGMGQGYQPVAAFNYGAKIYSRVRKGFWFTGLAGEVLLGIGAVACIVFARPLVAVFQPDPEVVAIAFPALRYQSVACFFLPLSVCANMMFQSVGLAGRASFLSALRSGLLFIPLIWLLPLLLGLPGVQLAQAVSDALTFVISMPLALYFLNRLPEDRLA